MLILGLLVVGAHLLYALWAGVAYPFGPGWFPIRRTERPFGYWAAVAEFVLIGTGLLLGAAGF